MDMCHLLGVRRCYVCGLDLTCHVHQVVLNNEVSHDVWWRIARCAFLSSAIDKDVMAIHKRFHIVFWASQGPSTLGQCEQGARHCRQLPPAWEGRAY